jgi:hypothetical protein
MTFGVFYSSLAPHGEWIPVAGAVFAWRPVRVDGAWRPYWNGQWVSTDDGWYWDSDEPWAWATYHYGRWYYDDYYGWLWLPGYDWSPAWVEWRYGGDYVGWAPLGPYGVFDVRFGVYYTRPWLIPYHYWSFVDCGFMTSPGVHQYVYRTENNTRFIGRTRTAGSVRYDGGHIVTRGPDVSYVERRGNVRIHKAEVVDANSAADARALRNGERNRIGVYRPRIEERPGDQRPERPADLRERERVPSLDARDIDTRRREVLHGSGEEVERIEQSRAQLPVEAGPETRDTRWNNRERLNQRPVEPSVRPRSREDKGRPERVPKLNKGENVDRQRERRNDRSGVGIPGVRSPGENRPMNTPDGREQNRPAVPSSRGGERRGR